mmetsp:Transcript_17211/g.39089  ORF Transcript_17211/g.39089 Transcript_17211/m.39089 type:complete len:90 (+) Transcript_17211:318-587(+)
MQFNTNSGSFPRVCQKFNPKYLGPLRRALVASDGKPVLYAGGRNSSLVLESKKKIAQSLMSMELFRRNRLSTTSSTLLARACSRKNIAQ